ncbi:hypothetical protein [Staphylococcus epidermidis]|uniref:hypothetical protein n=1 Tax=Staphylococcus epidermidis TaxID=1282 RepID=UPI0001A9645D|nr:hypothetical protein [Staphylococcus epidermidis]EES35649.1 hypothetical protein HMPREF0791_1740 [Staphylococcus epidermidis W23144]MBF2224516.1 hypothetical protein [Staphylococcus epidermidis]MCG1102678.1 hypothetical protein [Staphylococcus epidermidis]MCG2202656.1 hypothetical protein [Staphylococcus epidermidis]MCG2222281.1 hypothetical protein [Staphylococcus epidermidis]
MEIKEFKKWLVEKGFDEDELFKESIKTYNAEAYKASYLFSYLAFMNIIKKRIMNYSKVPSSFERKIENENIRQKKWKEKLDDLRDEEKWEQALFNLIKQQTDKNIFDLKTSVSDSFVEKRILRNVAAHNKKRKIDDSTVNELWNLFEYSLEYFEINGSYQTWLDRLDLISTFSNEEEIEKNIKKLMQDYKQLSMKSRKIIFQKVIEEYNNAFKFDSSNRYKIIKIIIEKLVSNLDEDIHNFIDTVEQDIFVFLNNESYNLKFVNYKIREYALETKVNKVIQMIKESSLPCKVNKLLILINSSDYEENWIRIIEKVNENNRKLIGFSEDLLELISGSFDHISNKCQNLFTFKNSNNNLQHTETVDYLKWTIYKFYWITALNIIIKKKINTDISIDIIKRTKKLLDFDYDIPYYKQNYLFIIEDIKNNVENIEYIENYNI